MKVLSWNSRGVNNSTFRRDAKELLRTHRPDIICFLETKADFGSNALSFIRRFGYEFQFQVPASGFARGLWLCWKTLVQLSVIFSTSQAIHCSVCFRGENIFLTFGYVRPTEAYKTEFWKHMLDWKEGHSGAWVLMGDFNDVASSEEISPRTTTIFNRAQRFRNRMASCGLMEMETLGCKFTWCRTRGGRVVLRERLDRVLINSDCQHRLQGAKAFNLPRTCSDHHPILLSLDTVASHSPINKPARFEAAWLFRPEFSTVFTQAWSQHANHLSAAINATGEACLSWGKSVFGNIYRKKRLLKARITGIQNSPRYSTSSWLQRLEVSLLGEYQQVLYEEELLWFQKSRVDWIASRDRNTSFYHMSTMVRRNKNKIGALKIGGEWIMDSFVLQTHVKTFFEELFARRETVPLLEDLSAYQPIISDADHASLLQLATLEEVRKALFSMKGLKSPGPDGISALFYQRHWDTVAGTFLEFVNQALLIGVFEPSLTKAYVALIPKEDSPNSIQKFRPISLLNVAYKVLSKIIVNRLRPHLQELVGPWQSSFLAGRSTVDNIILTQEAVHSMNHLKGRKGAMMLKIDLHKAFDSVDWGFLQQVLLEFNIPHQLVKLIMFSITSVQLGILWNGEPLPFFRPQRGLRQGDPLSPYLFILVMERLAHMIQRRVASRTWQPFKLSRGGVSLSHLFFADDLMLFAQASIAQLDIIMDCLNQFAKSSGLVLNLQRSKLFFSPNVHSAVANSLSARCDIPLTFNLGTYLGIPITHTRHSHKNYGYILEKVQRRLSNWKSANLSLAGRKILVQPVTASIPTYTMQTTLLPKTTCDSIDRLNRDFLWGSNSEARKPHLVNWEAVCSEKKQGGLGLRSAWENNQAFVAKLGWRLLKGDKALWCKAIQTKYLRGLSPLNAKANPRCSFIWREILQCCPLLQQGVRWRVGTGEGINFWHDNWVGNAPFINVSGEGPVDSSLLVADVINSDGEWDLDFLHTLVPVEIVEIIKAIPLSRNLQLTDSIFWAGSMDGSFTVRSAYQLIQEQKKLDNSSLDSWSWVWKLCCAERIRMFIWLLVRGRVLTNSLRFDRHMFASCVCPRCDVFEETHIHLLRDCYYAKIVWGLLGFATFEFFALELVSWIKKFSNPSRQNRHAGVSQTMVFLSTIWILWKDRNALIFRSHKSRPQELCARIFQQAQYTMMAMNPILSPRSRQPRWVSWIPPEEGWCKLNSDGSYNAGDKSAGAGGLIGDSTGCWISGFTVNVGDASIFIAELWGLREGLRLCKSLGLSKIVAEMDSLMVVRFIQEHRMPDNLSAAILVEIQSLMLEFEAYLLQHTLREGNAAADFLASLGHSLPPGLRIWSSPLSGLRSILTGDQLGTCFLRF
ncbi:hypothetical protein SLE2022_138910 [Rubroshorea leprosula]